MPWKRQGLDGCVYSRYISHFFHFQVNTGEIVELSGLPVKDVQFGAKFIVILTEGKSIILADMIYTIKHKQKNAVHLFIYCGISGRGRGGEEGA